MVVTAGCFWKFSVSCEVISEMLHLSASKRQYEPLFGLVRLRMSVQFCSVSLCTAPRREWNRDPEQNIKDQCEALIPFLVNWVTWKGNNAYSEMRCHSLCCPRLRISGFLWVLLASLTPLLRVAQLKPFVAQVNSARGPRPFCHVDSAPSALQPTTDLWFLGYSQGYRHLVLANHTGSCHQIIAKSNFHALLRSRLCHWLTQISYFISHVWVHLLSF